MPYTATRRQKIAPENFFAIPKYSPIILSQFKLQTERRLNRDLAVLAS